ncbi:hypothetical protein GYB22_09165 [bacterium]|nr:hypothetical protein [bacterium]
MKKALYLIILITISSTASAQLDDFLEQAEFRPALEQLKQGNTDSSLKLLDQFEVGTETYYQSRIVKMMLVTEMRGKFSDSTILAAYADAEKALKHIPDLNSDEFYGSFYNFYGIALKSAGYTDSGVAMFKKGYELNGGEMLLSNLIGTYASLEQYDQSRAYHQDVMAHPEMNVANMQMARTYVAIGIQDSAVYFLERATANFDFETTGLTFFHNILDAYEELGMADKVCELSTQWMQSLEGTNYHRIKPEDFASYKSEHCP